MFGWRGLKRVVASTRELRILPVGLGVRDAACGQTKVAFGGSNRYSMNDFKDFRRWTREPASFFSRVTKSPARWANMVETFTLSVECRLAASHVLPGCPPCDRLHGHTWTVRCHWRFVALDDMGMGINFHRLKSVLDEVIRSRFDHRHLNDIPPFDTVAPTAENLARETFRLLATEFDPGPDGRLARVEVWEGPESLAAYENDQSQEGPK